MPALEQIHRQRGFGLVEILVGMAVGLVVTIIIYQVISTYEGVKRTTTSGADTQQNGIFSLSTMERDVRAAGWGIPTADLMPCSRYFTYFSDGTINGPVPNFPSTPVRIIDGGTAAGASDSITVLWGSSVRANVRNALLQNVTANPTGTPASNLQPTTSVALSSTGGFVSLTDDVGNCALTRITGTAPNPASPGTVILSHDPGTGSSTQPVYNPPASYMTAQGWPVSYSTNPRIFDLGALTQRTYYVAGGSLMSQDYFSSTSQIQVANNVVSFKARYGISDAGSQVVNNWVSATGAWATPSVADLKRIKAVRIAVVVRSPLKERLPDGATACAITTTAPASWPGGPAIDLSNDPDWRCYRYRSFETVVPLRNVLWANLS
ncbi:PilW family protein [Variovorax atrisoli]|jgi:type IV pilus assembly protein PilW|uniref:PilW family protein n=1 Tax=Variovorax atrisoli TaxID=3394203 RepID=UPI00161CA141|nr:PilW family protein [Variovorax sp. BK613]MBB3640808.1 type IV pilus assembly protein PilW [Variovorax sp. BK613]